MPTTTIYGKKGGGKTYYAVRNYILPELVRGSRVVVTNVALKLPELAEYIARKYPNANVDLNKRVRILTREESRRFWLHRGPGVDLADVSDRDYDEGRNPDYSSVAGFGGVLYVIDEIHIDFDARNWVKVGRGLTYYNSQERKLCDDQVFITQFLGLVDRRVKDFSQEYVVCRNYVYEKFLTFFSKGSSMQACHYPSQPSGNLADLPDEKHRYRLCELRHCYDTSVGVGFIGAGHSDTARKSKARVPWWVIFASVPAAVFGLNFVLTRAQHAVTRKPDVETAEAAAAPAPVVVANPLAVRPAAPSPLPAPAIAPNAKESLRVVGFSVSSDGKRALVLLSDGRSLSHRDSEFGGLEPSGNAVWVDGKKLWLNRAVSASPAPSPVVPAVVKPVDAKPAKDSYTDERVVAVNADSESLAHAAARPSIMSGGESAPVKRMR